MTVTQILEQKALVQNAMKSAMIDGQHYGKVPGCGDKPTLLQPGAEMLLLLFRMNPDYAIERRDMERDHIEYNVVCRLTNASGQFIGAGVGSACTMESKWRFRTGPKKLTDKPVPSEYWNVRKTDPAKATELLGGKGFSTQKNEAGAWMIAEGGGEKVENDNPADVYNTCLKIAKKRALVDAVRTRTAASDIFAQDLEDLKDNIEASQSAPIDVDATVSHSKPDQAPQSTTQPQRETKAQGNTQDGNTIVECQFVDYNNRTGTSARGPWSAWFCKFEHDGQAFEAGTFDKKIGESLDTLKGSVVRLEYKSGKKTGTYEIVSIEPADLMP
jgi:hypothetical protein